MNMKSKIIISTITILFIALMFMQTTNANIVDEAKLKGHHSELFVDIIKPALTTSDTISFQSGGAELFGNLVLMGENPEIISEGTLSIGAGGDANMMINNEGNVYIGSASPFFNQKLNVKGDIRANRYFVGNQVGITETVSYLNKNEQECQLNIQGGIITGYNC